MKTIIFRNCSINILVAYVVVCSIAIILGTVGIYSILTIYDQPLFTTLFRIITAIIIGLFVCIPCLLVIVKSCIAYFETIEISESSILFCRFGLRKCQLELSQITVFGCAAFAHRNGYIFFSSTPRNKIMDFARKHQHNTLRLFGKNRINNLCRSEDGLWQLSVGTYVQMCRRRDRKNIIIIEYASPEILKTISNYLQENPILTGPIILDQPEMWVR